MSKGRKRSRHKPLPKPPKQPKARNGAKPRPVLVALLGWLIAFALVAGVGAFLAVGANGPEDPRLEPAAAPRDPALSAEFSEVAFTVAPGEGGLVSTTEKCAVLAETDLQLQKGMMGRTDFGGYDAMIFRFPADTTSTFFMRNVPIPLSIAWFDSSGRFVSAADMEPCPDQEGCPQYPAAGPYRFALEAEKGGLTRLGISPNSVLSLGGPCPAATAGG